jgi:hypothetical protein
MNITRNATTVERIAGRWATRRNPYRRDGCIANWEEVCGSRRWLPLWPCPLPLPGRATGFEYGEETAQDDEAAPFLRPG